MLPPSKHVQVYKKATKERHGTNKLKLHRYNATSINLVVFWNIVSTWLLVELPPCSKNQLNHLVAGLLLVPDGQANDQLGPVATVCSKPSYHLKLDFQPNATEVTKSNITF